jgi:hypothetical protein
VDIEGLSPEIEGKWPGGPVEGRGRVTKARNVRGIYADIGGLRWIKLS